MSNPWDFNSELDTQKSYVAFSAYLNMGAERSLERTEALVYNRPQGSPKRASGFIKNWCLNGQWVARAQEYDNANAHKVLAAVQRNDIERRKNSLEQFRSSAELIAKREVRILETISGHIQDCFLSKVNSTDGVSMLPKEAGEIDFQLLSKLMPVYVQVKTQNPWDNWAKSLQIDRMQEQLDKLEAAQGGSKES